MALAFLGNSYFISIAIHAILSALNRLKLKAIELNLSPRSKRPIRSLPSLVLHEAFKVNKRSNQNQRRNWFDQSLQM